ncbi:MAG: non-heme iron oxygenase ferredoxin subunit [Acidimicrobiia bacterium]
MSGNPMTSGDAVKLCRLDELVDGGARKFVVGKRQLAVIRLGSDVYVIGDVCSHADVSLSEGEVDAENCEIECIKHGSAFSLVTGVPSTLPATQAVPVYDVSVVDGDVIVNGLEQS